jgi:cytoskeletal protein RodZ
MKQSREAGEVNPLLITNIISGLLVVILTGLMIWLFMGYNDYKNNADQKVTVAVDKAKKDQQKTDETAFLEREKVPTRTFTGPSDLGSVSFQYPKTWSTYVAKQSLELEAYLHPDFVPPVSNTQPFAIRVVVEDRSYDTVLKNYEPLVKKGSLRSNPVTIEGFSGIRLDGTFTKEREGSAVLFKVRDKTLTIATDASAYKNDFDNTILKSLKFNP